MFHLRARPSARGPLGAYLLGVAFSFASCPTLFWLFFGLTIPLALRSTGGWTFPGVFPFGSSLAAPHAFTPVTGPSETS